MVTQLEFLKALAQKSQGTSAQGPSRLEFLRRLAAMGAGLGADVDVSDAELEPFRRLVMDRPDDLRRKLLGANALRRRALNGQRQALLDTLDVDPDLLEPIGELRYEPTHTRLVQYFLSLSRDGALPEKLARDFLGLAEVQPELVPDDLTTLTIRRERFSDEGRVDLWIEMPKAVVLVEMKIDAIEGKDQLVRYRSALDKARGTRVGILVYLTLPEAPRSDSKAPHVHFSLRDLLVAWIPYASTSHGVSGYLGRYLKSIARLLQCAGAGRFDQWNVTQQRAALRLVTTTG